MITDSFKLLVTFGVIFVLFTDEDVFLVVISDFLDLEASSFLATLWSVFFGLLVGLAVLFVVTSDTCLIGKRNLFMGSFRSTIVRFSFRNFMFA